MAGFYQGLATVVTDLLTDKGAAVTLTRTTAVFDPASGKDTTSSTVAHATVGLYQNIHANMIDGTRIRAGDKMLLVDASVAPLAGDKVDGWSVVEITEINPAGIALAYRLVLRK